MKKKKSWTTRTNQPAFPPRFANPPNPLLPLASGPFGERNDSCARGVGEPVPTPRSGRELGLDDASGSNSSRVPPLLLSDRRSWLLSFLMSPL